MFPRPPDPPYDATHRSVAITRGPNIEKTMFAIGNAPTVLPVAFPDRDMVGYGRDMVFQKGIWFWTGPSHESTQFCAANHVDGQTQFSQTGHDLGATDQGLFFVDL